MRPRDPLTGALMPPPCKRYNTQPFYQRTLPVICEDPRSPALPLIRKLELIDRAINTVIDGDKTPVWVCGDPARPENRFMAEIWATAVSCCREVADGRSR